MRVECDRCPARATHYWTQGALLLTYCGHHDRQHQAAMTVLGWARHRLPAA